MLRIRETKSASRAKRYYSSADYYSEGQELIGYWRGEGAKRLGLSGTIDRSDWDRMCDNIEPQSGEPLTVRRKAERRVGYDISFGCPKGVSLLYGLTQDERILQAFRESVQETMQDMETEAKTRVRSRGRNEDRITGNLVWGEFVHFTARPEEGIPDPHLHAHCFAFNATFDSNENRWKAGQFGDLKADAPYFEAVFRARLARRMEELGLSTVRTNNGWDLAGIDKKTLDNFSRRTARIEKLARELGITDPKLKDNLGAQTRGAKTTDLSMPQLKSIWASRLTTSEASGIADVTRNIGVNGWKDREAAASEAVQRSIEHTFERNSVVSERAFLTEALKQGFGKASRETIERLAAAESLIRATRKGRRLVTTRQVIEEETRMLAFARSGRAACRPMNAGRTQFTREWLNAGQKATVRHVLTSRDRVILIRGAAGTGKTTMMQEAREGIDEAGLNVFAFAPSASASRGTLRAEGFASADTVARLLTDRQLQEQVRGGVVWVDEAGLLGTKTMRELFDLAERTDARIVLSGDRRQHGSVERGAALRLLEEEAGLRPAELKEIQRQKAQYKAAIKALSEERTEEGFRRLDELGWIREVADEDRDRELATAYVDTVQAGRSGLVVSPTHAEGGRIAAEIRRLLRERGLLGQEERAMTELVPVHLTLGERKDALNYRPGDVLVFNQNAKGFRKSQRVIVGYNKLPLDQAERFSVYRPRDLKLSPGDRIRITRNGATADDKHRLNNGDLFTVRGFNAEGDIELTNGWIVPADYGHFAQGVVVTSYASQGKTVDRVYVGTSSKSFAAASREQFYVSASRGREQVIVFTDDKESLLDAVSQSDERLSATELFQRSDAARNRFARERIADAARVPTAPIHGREREWVDHER